jgi:hypothetical protein
MHNQNPFQDNGRPEANRSNDAGDTQPSREWSAFEHDLEALGRQLAQLRAHGAALGEHVVNELEQRCRLVTSRAKDYQRATESQLDALRRQAGRHGHDAQTAYNEARTRSKEVARQVWERSVPLREGARDVGEGLTRAWSELRASLGKAAGRLQTPPPSSRPGTIADDKHDAT